MKLLPPIDTTRPALPAMAALGVRKLIVGAGFDVAPEGSYSTFTSLAAATPPTAETASSRTYDALTVENAADFSDASLAQFPDATFVKVVPSELT